MHNETGNEGKPVGRSVLNHQAKSPGGAEDYAVQLCTVLLSFLVSL